SAGLAGGLTGNSTASAAVGAQSGKNAVENNSLSAGWNNILPSGTQDYGQAVASWNQYAQDNNLTPEQVQEGMNRIAIGEGPSWGTTYKVHPVVQAGGDVSFIRGYTLSGTIDDNHISVNQGDIYSIGAHGGASIGLSFGPYFPGLINSNDNDYSINGGFGVGAVGLSTGKDGVSFTFGFGPSWGWSATEIKGVDVNGTSTSEVYRYDFK
ncbi:polymorphic toxin type 25 domain-containing protein, partial [Escherichia coli]|nr:polymorphic toxin type 25 domain-containing protein [Escherichia coli]